MMDAYQRWWDTEGSAMRPHKHEDLEEFARRITEIAWSNGQFVEKEACAQVVDDFGKVKEQLRLCNVDQFTTVAELAEAVTKERERCAKVCEEISNSMYWLNNRKEIAEDCAAAIRKGE